MDTRTTHNYVHAVLSDLIDLLDQIPDAAGTDPTPCTDYNVAVLRRHVIGWLTAFTDGFSNDDGLCSDGEAVAVLGNGSDQTRALRDRLAAVLPDAAERPLSIGGAALPGPIALSMILWEYQVHGWDLARATGLPWDPDEAGLAASLAFAPGMLTEDYQGEGKSFAPAIPVPDDATALDRLVALSGRDPHWAV